MSHEMPDLVVYQGRWFDDSEVHETNVRWSEWKIIQDWEYIEMLKHINNGAKYQVRILRQVIVRGFGVTDEEPVPNVYVNPGY
jgi:hypothetical protein